MIVSNLKILWLGFTFFFPPTNNRWLVFSIFICLLFCLNCSIFFKSIIPMLIYLYEISKNVYAHLILYCLIRVCRFRDFLRQRAPAFQKGFTFQRLSQMQIPLLFQPCQPESLPEFRASGIGLPTQKRKWDSTAIWVWRKKFASPIWTLF